MDAKDSYGCQGFLGVLEIAFNEMKEIEMEIEMEMEIEPGFPQPDPDTGFHPDPQEILFRHFPGKEGCSPPPPPTPFNIAELLIPIHMTIL